MTISQQFLNCDLLYILCDKYLNLIDSKNLLNINKQLYNYKNNLFNMLIKKILKHFNINKTSSTLQFNNVNIQDYYYKLLNIYNFFKNHNNVDNQDIIKFLIKNKKENLIDLDILRFMLLEIKCNSFNDNENTFILRNSTLKQKKVILKTNINIPCCTEMQLGKVPNFYIIFSVCIIEIIKIKDCKLLVDYYKIYKNKDFKNSYKIIIIIPKESVKKIVENASFKFLNLLIDLFLGEFINMNQYIKSICEGIISLGKIIDNSKAEFEKMLMKLSDVNKKKVLQICKINFD